MQDVTHICTIEDLLVHLSAGPPSQILDFDRTRTLRLTSNWKAPSDSLTVTWAYPRPCAIAQLGQGGGVVANVILDLAINGALLLHGSSQLRFRNCVIQGVSACQRQQRPPSGGPANPVTMLSTHLQHGHMVCMGNTAPGL